MNTPQRHHLPQTQGLHLALPETTDAWSLFLAEIRELAAEARARRATQQAERSQEHAAAQTAG